MKDNYLFLIVTIFSLLLISCTAQQPKNQPLHCEGNQCNATLVTIQYKTPIFNANRTIITDQLYQKTASGCYVPENKTALELLCHDPYAQGKYTITCTPTWNITTCLEI